MTVSISAEKTKELVGQYGANDKDTGSAAAQIAILTERIANLTKHLQEHEKDFGTRRGLLKLIGKRRRLQAYYQEHNPGEYVGLIKSLGLRR
jgi:small subunit ribosomal protein S15